MLVSNFVDRLHFTGADAVHNVAKGLADQSLRTLLGRSITESSSGFPIPTGRVVGAVNADHVVPGCASEGISSARTRETTIPTVIGVGSTESKLATAQVVAARKRGRASGDRGVIDT